VDFIKTEEEDTLYLFQMESKGFLYNRGTGRVSTD